MMLSPDFGDGWAVEFTWNTDEHNRWVEDDERPRTVYGPFYTREAAQDFAEHFCEDDTDVHDVEVISLNLVNDVDPLACAECGTDKAQTYVVTTLDPENPRETRTEVCLSCHEKIEE